MEQLLRLIGERPFRVFTSDQRVRSEHGRFASYPDVVVVCGVGEGRRAAYEPSHPRRYERVREIHVA